MAVVVLQGDRIGQDSKHTTSVLGTMSPVKMLMTHSQSQETGTR